MQDYLNKELINEELLKSKYYLILKAMKLVSYLLLCFLCISCSDKNVKNSDEEKNVMKTTSEVPDTVCTKVRGIDVSRYQGNIDWDKVKEDGLLFAYCKATDGITYTDPDFEENWAKIGNINMLRGAYHFYESNDNPEEQALNFLKAISLLTEKDLPAVLDIEWNGFKQGTDTAQYREDILRWLSIVEDSTGKQPIIYTSASYANQYISSDEFAKYNLWVAEYGVSSPRIPEIWENKGYLFWQKACKDTFSGISGTTDYDIFNGTEAEIAALCK